MRRFLGIGLGLLLAGQASADGCHLTRYGTLPVDLVANQPTTIVRINGQDSRFMLDTGSFFDLMSRASAAALGLQVSPAPFALRLSGVGGESAISQTHVRELGLPDGTIENVAFIVGGSDTGYGLLGANLLDFADLEMDLAHGRMTLFRTEHCGHTPLAYWTRGDGYEVADLEPTHDRYDRRTLLDVTVNGTRLRAVLDSGAAATVMTRRAAERAGIALDGPGATRKGDISGIGSKPVQAWTVDVGAFTVGTETIRHSQMLVLDGSLGDDRTDLLLGVDFLLAHHVFVANSQRKLYFTYNGGRVFSYAPATGPKPADPATPGNNTAAAPNTAAGYALRGQARLARGEVDAALADLDEAIRRAPERADYYLARARVQVAGRHADAALADLDESMRLDPKNVDALLMRTELHYEKGDRTAAWADAQATGALAAEGSEQARTVADYYIALDHPDAALPMLDAWIRLHPDDVALGAELADRCWARTLANRQLDDALHDCRKAIKRDGGKANYLDDLGLVQLRLGHYAEAIEAYGQALAKDKDKAWSHYGRGLAELRAGQAEAGHADLEAAHKLDPTVEVRAAKYGLTAQDL